MTRVLVEVMDLKEVPKSVLRQLRKASFGDGGWMCSLIDQLQEGYVTLAEWVSEGRFEGHVKSWKQELNYSRAHALIARDEDGQFLGWALVRHPRKIVKAKVSEWEKEHYGVGQYEYGGRRSDFMVYVKRQHRKKRVARTLLLIAYNNFGRVDVYPHDLKSERFYERNARFVTAHDTRRFTNAKYKTREVY